MIRKLLLVVVMVALISSSFSCGLGEKVKPSVSGTYVNQETTKTFKAGEYIELRSDGTSFMGGGTSGITVVGKWEVEGDVITIITEFMGFTVRGEIKGDTIVLEDGSTWIKEKEKAVTPTTSTPSPKEATTKPTSPAATPPLPSGTTIVGDFTVALSSVAREETVATLSFTVTKISATRSNGETVRVTLTDGHENKYQGDLSIIPEGSPDDFLTLLPQDFTYVAGVTITMPEAAPIMRIKLGEGEEEDFKDVQYVKPSLKQDFGEATIQAGASCPLGKYLIFVLNGPVGGVIGWELPVTVVNTEYNPITVDVGVGLQLTDGSVVWNKTGTKTLTVPGSGQAILEPEIIALSQDFSDYIPAALLIHYSEGSTNQAELKMMAITPDQFPPLPERIAFVSSGDIFVAMADGSGQRRLTLGGYPDWSPDGTKLVFSRQSRMYIIASDGTGGKKLLGKGLCPAWSPDGKQIAFCSGNYIYLMNLDGSGKANKLTFGVGARWSPDGSRLVVVDAANVYVINADGSAKTNLTRAYNQYYGITSLPDWSPDGTKLVFTDDDQIYVMNADGSGKTKLAVGGAPSWLPNGDKIIFDGNDNYIYIIQSDGSGKTRITEGHNPVWVGLAKLNTAPPTPARESTEAPISATALQVANLGVSELIELRSVIREVLTQAELTANEDENLLLNQSEIVLEGIASDSELCDIVGEKTEEDRLKLDLLSKTFAAGVIWWAKVFHGVAIPPSPVFDAITAGAEDLGNRIGAWLVLGQTGYVKMTDPDNGVMDILYETGSGVIWAQFQVYEPAGGIYIRVPVEPRLVSSEGGGNIILSEGIRPIMETVRIAYRLGNQ